MRSEISRALKNNARLQVRMGIHSGPVSGVVDLTERTNVAGAGVNMAQRVMDCGDSGHIIRYCVFRGISVTSGRPSFERGLLCLYLPIPIFGKTCSRLSRRSGSYPLLARGSSISLPRIRVFTIGWRWNWPRDSRFLRILCRSIPH